MTGALPFVAPGVPVIPTGLPGPTGFQGNTGASWVDDSPTDGQTYARQPGSWVPALPLLGATVGGGISLGSAVVTTAYDCSRHIAFGTSSGGGFAISNNTLAYVFPQSGLGIRFYFGTTAAFTINTGVVGWGLGSSAQPALSYSSGNQTASIFSSQGSVYAEYNLSSSTLVFYDTNGVYCTNILQMNGTGLQPYTATYTNGFSQRWDGTWIYARIDQSIEYAIAQACDERMKQDIAPSQFDALAALRKVRLYQYRWKDRFSSLGLKDRHIPVGFIAQRLAEDYPHGAHAPGGKVRGATRLGTANRNVMLATLCRAVQQLDERMQALR